MNKLLVLLISLLIFSLRINSQILLEESEYSDKDFPFVILSEGFNTSGFPPPGWSSQIIAGSYNWSLSGYSAYCLGFGSAIFPFSSAGIGSMARLTSPTFTPTAQNRDSLIFSQAYCQRPGMTDALDIYVSSNSGSTWQLFISYTSPSLSTAPASSGFFTPNCNQWQNKSLYLPLNTNRIFFQAVSGNGNNLYLDEILVKPSGLSGISNYSGEIPVKFQLYNNFPNPFNPSTKIRFDITERTNIKLIVYNSLGKEITVLVNNTLSPGKYETSFTALNLASGIYFYRMVTSNYSEVKKMMLIK